MSTRHQLENEIGRAMRADRCRLRRQLRALGEPGKDEKSPDSRLTRLADAVRRSVALREARRRGVPPVRYDDDLPVSAKRDEISRAIRDHQVVIICGETGSGKSTQLPKICLELGRGIDGLIGHTQPRRIAARSVAARITEELDSPLGRDVGFKVRFAEALSPQTYIKLMTDGILLAETQGDAYLDQYDTIILDEAHERSLNIDFIIGYLKRLLPKRRDLKLIITSATIDAARFSAHFRAICCRLENLPDSLPRDWQNFQEFQPRWQLYLEQARHYQAQGIVDPELLHLRWMLEEYRVSLFAQKLGTAISVSPKRLEQQWVKLRA